MCCHTRMINSWERLQLAKQPKVHNHAAEFLSGMAWLGSPGTGWLPSRQTDLRLASSPDDWWLCFLFSHSSQWTEEKPRVNSNYLLVGFFGITLLRYGGLLLLVLLCVTPSKIDFCLKSKIRFILPESVGGPSPCQPCQLLHRCHNQPGMKTKEYFLKEKVFLFTFWSVNQVLLTA